MSNQSVNNVNSQLNDEFKSKLKAMRERRAKLENEIKGPEKKEKPSNKLQMPMSLVETPIPVVLHRYGDQGELI
jgi:hypothetical protein